jgi:hypothetical protein
LWVRATIEPPMLTPVGGVLLCVVYVVNVERQHRTGAEAASVSGAGWRR